MHSQTARATSSASILASSNLDSNACAKVKMPAVASIDKLCSGLQLGLQLCQLCLPGLSSLSLCNFLEDELATCSCPPNVKMPPVGGGRPGQNFAAGAGDDRPRRGAYCLQNPHTPVSSLRFELSTQGSELNLQKAAAIHIQICCRAYVRPLGNMSAHRSGFAQLKKVAFVRPAPTNP